MENKKLFLILPIPISTNKYLYPKVTGRFARLAESNTSKKWKKSASKIIKAEMKNQKWETVERGQFLDVHIDYFFKQKGQDPNNYLKVLYDVMENCGVYENDDMCKPQTGIVVIDKFNPRVEITISFSEQVGAFKNIDDREKFIDMYENKLKKSEFNKTIKLLDDNRLTEDVYYDNNKGLYFK